MTVLDQLADYLGRLPGVGKKSAVRMAYHFLESDDEYNELLGQAIRNVKKIIKPCSVCGVYTEADPCNVCSSTERDSSLMCVVETSQDFRNIESTRAFNGIYHVLGGLLSPLDGIGPEELRLDKMAARIEDNGVTELIIATNPTLEGDTTALYIQKLLSSKKNLAITRLATGLPVGGDLEYADKLTLSRSLKGRFPL